MHSTGYKYIIIPLMLAVLVISGFVIFTGRGSLDFLRGNTTKADKAVKVIDERSRKLREIEEEFGPIRASKQKFVDDSFEIFFPTTVEGLEVLGDVAFNKTYSNSLDSLNYLQIPGVDLTNSFAAQIQNAPDELFFRQLNEFDTIDALNLDFGQLVPSNANRVGFSIEFFDNAFSDPKRNSVLEVVTLNSVYQIGINSIEKTTDEFCLGQNSCNPIDFSRSTLPEGEWFTLEAYTNQNQLIFAINGKQIGTFNEATSENISIEELYLVARGDYPTENICNQNSSQYCNRTYWRNLNVYEL